MISSTAAVSVAAVALPVPTHSQGVPFLLPTTEREEIGCLIYRCSNSAKSPSCRPLPLTSRGSRLAPPPPPPPADHEAPREEEQGKGWERSGCTVTTPLNLRHEASEGLPKLTGIHPPNPAISLILPTQLNSTLRSSCTCFMPFVPIKITVF